MKKGCISIGALAALTLITGCKTQVDVIDLAAHNDYMCALHSTDNQNSNPITCWGTGTSLPSGDSGAEVSESWQASLSNPTQLEILGNGLCVIDSPNELGEVKCLDKRETNPESVPFLLPTSAQTLLANYDVKNIKLGTVNADNMDFMGCALGEHGLRNQELICWSKESIEPIAFTNLGQVPFFSEQLIYIYDFDLARNQLCVKGETISGSVESLCLLPGVLNGQLSFKDAYEIPDYLAFQAGGDSATNFGGESSYCYQNPNSVIECSANISLEEEYFRWDKLYIGPKESVYFGELATACVTDIDLIECFGNPDTTNLTKADEFHPTVKDIDDVAIGESSVCYSAKNDEKYGVICAADSATGISNIPTHIAL